MIEIVHESSEKNVFLKEKESITSNLHLKNVYMQHDFYFSVCLMINCSKLCFLVVNLSFHRFINFDPLDISEP